MKKQYQISGKVILFIFLLLLLIAMIVLLSHFYRFLKKEEANPYAAITSQTWALVAGKNIETITQVFTQVDFSSDKTMQTLKNEMNDFVEFIHNEQFLKKNIAKEQIFVALQQNEKSQLFFICPISKSKQKKVEKQWNEKVKNAKSHQYKEILFIEQQYQENIFYVFYYQDVIVLSKSQTILRKSINEWHTEKQIDYHNFNFQSDDICILVNAKKNNIDSKDNEIPFQTIFLTSHFESQFIYLKGKFFIEANKNLLPSQEKTLPINDLVTCNATQIFYASESVFPLLQKEHFVAKKIDLTYSILHPLEVLTFAEESGKNYMIMRVKNIESVEEFLLSATETILDRDEFSGIDYDTFYCNSTMIGRIDLPNFIYSNWAIRGTMPKLKNYALQNNLIIFAENDSDMITYLQREKNENISKLLEISDDYFTDKVQLLQLNLKSTKDKKSQMLMRYQLNKFDDSTYFFNLFFKNP